MLQRLKERQKPWDLVLIGGGATGIGCALDAAARGYEVLLVEQADFGKGTSSRSTKLVHGGVRYLEQGNVKLVMEALHERGRLRANAPHLFRDLGFIVPSYRWWEKFYYGAGLKVYELLSGKWGIGNTAILSKRAALAQLPGLNEVGLRGGVVYFDGQFDDARLLIALAQTAVENGATLLNYTSAVGFLCDAHGSIKGVRLCDQETSTEYEVSAKIVVNATGAFCDAVRKLADPQAKPLISPSQGIHLVFDQTFLPGGMALMVPRTDDGRVMFAIPWHGHTLVGTTDTAIPALVAEPRPLEQEIEFILETAGRYLQKAPTREDVLSVFVGIRPLVKAGDAKNTAALSRDHTIQVEPNGLMTITGGKWTTYRYMAEDCVNQAAQLAGLPAKPCQTKELRLHGYQSFATAAAPTDKTVMDVYGADAAALQNLIDESPALGRLLHPDLPYLGAQVVWAARQEMARTVEDVLARRTRALFLNARAAIAAAPQVANLLASELGYGQAWEAAQINTFTELAQGYLLPPKSSANVS